MELDQIIQMLKGKTEVKLVRFISDKGPNIVSSIMVKSSGQTIQINQNCQFTPTADANL